MKKGIIVAMVVGGFFSLLLTSCGEKFTPLTEAQVSAQVDSLFTAQKDAKLEELRAACQSKAEAEASAKFEEMKNAAVASK